MCFINVLKKNAVSNLGYNRAARSVRGNTAYLTPPARYISSISFCHVHLHRTPAAAEGPLTWAGLPPGGHRPALAAACDSSLVPAARRSQCISGPSTCVDSEERAGGSQHSRPGAVEGSLFLQLFLQRASSPSFFFLSISWSSLLHFCRVLCLSEAISDPWRNS